MVFSTRGRVEDINNNQICNNIFPMKVERPLFNTQKNYTNIFPCRKGIDIKKKLG